jgi:uncharacterized cupredoxin-like copper-binding protein
MTRILLALVLLWGMPVLSQTGKVDSVAVTLSTQGNEIAFKPTTLQVKAGRRIRLQFVNAAKPGSDIHHDVAVLQPGTLDEVLTSLQKQGYQLDKMSQNPAVIAISKSLAPGEEHVLELEPLKPGSYPFVCLMAGHGDMLGMKGTLIVTP